MWGSGADAVCIETFGQVLQIDFRFRLEDYSLGFHDSEPPVDDGLVQFEIRNAEAQKSSDVFVLFEDSDFVASPVQLVCRGQTCRTGADDRRFPAVPLPCPRYDISFPECSFYDGGFIFADCHRSVDGQFQYTTFLAQSRTYPACEFRKVVCERQYFVGFLPSSVIHGILEFRRPVPERTGPMAERNAAVHASGGLEFPVAGVQGLLDFPEVQYAVMYRAVAGFLPWYRHECFRVSHNFRFNLMPVRRIF